MWEKDLPSNVSINRRNQEQQKQGNAQYRLCKLCFNRSPKNFFVSINDCDHFFCKQCQITKILESLDWKQQIKCPVDQCQAVICERSQLWKELSRDTQQRIFKIREGFQNAYPIKAYRTSGRISKKEYQSNHRINMKQKQYVVNQGYRKQDILIGLIDEQLKIAPRKTSKRQRIGRILLYPFVLAIGMPISLLLLMTIIFLGLMMSILFAAGYIAIGLGVVCYFLLQLELSFQVTMGAFIGLLISIILYFIHKLVKDYGIQWLSQFCEFSLRFTKRTLIFPCSQ